MKEPVRQRASIGDIRYGVTVDLVKIKWIGMGIDYGKNSVSRGDTDGCCGTSIVAVLPPRWFAAEEDRRLWSRSWLVPPSSYPFLFYRIVYDRRSTIALLSMSLYLPSMIKVFPSFRSIIPTVIWSFFRSYPFVNIVTRLVYISVAVCATATIEVEEG